MQATRQLAYGLAVFSVAIRSEFTEFTSSLPTKFISSDLEYGRVGNFPKKRLLKKSNSALRVVYLDGPYVTQNQAAISKSKEMGVNYEFGVTCDSAEAAIPEW